VSIVQEQRQDRVTEKMTFSDENHDDLIIWKQPLQLLDSRQAALNQL
jgi:hypothetical protein